MLASFFYWLDCLVDMFVYSVQQTALLDYEALQLFVDWV